MKTCTDVKPGAYLYATSVSLAAIVLATLLVTGCSAKHKPATQVVAKVNGDEISIHQLNNALTQLPPAPPEEVAKMRRGVLDNLVNQQLAVQGAIEQKLDRSTEVMMLIDASKREILTRAYLKNLVAGLPKPSTEEAQKFYDEHPQLFSQRRIYSLQEISLPSPHPPLAELQQMANGKSMAAIEEELKSRNIVYATNSGTRAAEQIALPLLTDLANLKDGQTSVTETPQMATILHVVASQLNPVKEDVALQSIPQFLMNEQAKIVINDKMEQLRKKSKIEYLNEFANDTPVDKVGVAVESTQIVARPTTETSNAPSSIERGMAGIK